MMLRLLVIGTVTAIGCDRLGAVSKEDPSAHVDAAPAPVVTTAPVASTAAVDAKSTAVPTTTPVASKIPKCAPGESFVEMGDGERGCATGCIDPSCDCRTGFIVLANGKVSAAPGDKRSFCFKAKPAAKKVLPKCGAGLVLVAEDDSSPPFCAKSCSADTDCKPAKCDAQAFNVDPQSGAVFTGVGKSIPICARGAAPSTSAPVASAPSGVASVPNPNNLPCPAGFSNAGGVLKTCNKICTLGGPCPNGTKCSDVLLVCR